MFSSLYMWSQKIMLNFRTNCTFGHSSSSFAEILNGLTTSYVCLILHLTVVGCGLSTYLLTRSSYSLMTFIEERIEISQEHRPYSQSCKMALIMPLFLAQSSLLHVLSWDILLSSGMLHNTSASSCITPLFDALAPRHLGNLLFPATWANSENSMGECLMLK